MTLRFVAGRKEGERAGVPFRAVDTIQRTGLAGNQACLRGRPCELWETWVRWMGATVKWMQQPMGSRLFVKSERSRETERTRFNPEQPGGQATKPCLRTLSSSLWTGTRFSIEGIGFLAASATLATKARATPPQIPPIISVAINILILEKHRSYHSEF